MDATLTRTSAWQRRAVLAAVAAASLVLAMLTPMTPADATPSRHGDTDKVSLCHATASRSNPYVIINVDPASIFRVGHDGHHEDKGSNAGGDRPVNFYDLVFLNGQERWDDVIPAFHYDYMTGQTHHQGFYAGKNWTGPDWNGPSGDRDGAIAALQAACAPDDEPPGPEGQLTVEKTAEATYNRTHNWSLDKSVNQTTFNLAYPSGTGTANYTIDVTYDGFDDADWLVSGLVTISNTGTDAAYIDSITDSMDPDAEFTCMMGDDPFDYLSTGLQPTEEIDCSYSIELLEAEDGTNTVTVEGEDGEGDPIEDAEASANYTFGDPEPVTNATVSVEDVSDIPGLGTQSLGTRDAADFEPGDKANPPFTYSHTFNYGDFSRCGPYEYDNTASVYGDDAENALDSDSETVTVNVQCRTFQGETATGRGFKWSATNGAPSTWFMYTPWNTTGVHQGINTMAGADLVAGQHHNIGKVKGTRGATTTTLNFTINAPWQLKAVANNVKINPMACGTAQAYKSPGKFTVKKTKSSNTFSVSGLSNTACYGIHLDVGRYVLHYQ